MEFVNYMSSSNHGKYFDDDEKLTKFGYFQVRDFKSFSKYEAWQYAYNNNISLSELNYNFNDEYLNQFDWSVEPTETIDELYVKRARQLREKYDYLVLMYSGGIDSHVVLHTFLDNNIKIDEIIVCTNLKYLSKKHKFNQEVFETAIPRLESLKLSEKNIKINIVDVGELISKQYLDNTQLNNFLYNANGTLSTWTIAIRSWLFKLQQQHQIEISKSGNKIGYIWGLDKPAIRIENNNYCFKYDDSAPDFACKNFFSKKVYGNELSNFTDEAFYVSKEVPELTIKQAHLICSELKKMSANDPRLVTADLIANTGPFVKHKSDKWLSKKQLERLIYPNAPIEIFGNDKIKGSIMFTTRDAWFFRSKTESRNRFITKIKIALREHQDYFMYSIDGYPKNSINICGIPHIITQCD